jgi:hypothetical protein
MTHTQTPTGGLHLGVGLRALYKLGIAMSSEIAENPYILIKYATYYIFSLARDSLKYKRRYISVQESGEFSEYTD